MIDSSVLIAFERETPSADAISHLDGSEEFFISVVSASELLHGVHRARDAGIRNRRAAWVNALLDAVPVLDIDLAIARAHAQLWGDLAEKGALIGPHDMWLAATALARGLRMVTHKVREFAQVPGLDVQVWPPSVEGPWR